MKILLYSLIAFVSFIGALALALLLTGNLSKQALEQVMGKEAVLEMEGQSQDENLGALAEEIKQKEATFTKREQQLKARETQLIQRELELEQLRTQLESIQKEIDSSLENADKARQVRLQTVALTIASMKADKAAERLEELPPEDVAEILQLIEKDKDRGKIMESLEPKFATRVLRALQEKKL